MRTSFIIHLDTASIVNELTKEQAGALFKAIVDYNSGVEPQLSPLVKIAFHSFKAQFDRDIENYEKKSKANQENGAKGGRPRKPKESEINPKKPTGLIGNPQKGYSDSKSDNDSKKEKKYTPPLSKGEDVFSFKDSFLKLKVEPNILDDWLKVRKKKNASNTETAYKRIIKEINSSGKSANECIRICAENSWSGFKKEFLENKTTPNTSKKDFNANEYGKNF